MDLGIWATAILILCLFSIFYKEGPLYRFAEATSIGFSAGYGFIVGLNSLKDYLYRYWVSQPQYDTIIPVIIGILFYFRLVPGKRYLQRIPIAFQTGMGLGLSLPTMMQSQFVLLILGAATLIPLDLIGAFSWLIALVAFVTVTLYFIFSYLKTSKFDPPRKIARYFLMLSLGASFGGAALTWIVNVISRIQFLLISWLGL